MDTVSVSGGTLEYETAGAGEALVLIHGSVIGHGLAGLLREPSLTSHFQVTNYHRRGFLGSSRHTGPFSIKQQADDARAVIAEVAGGRAHVAGHSYGAVTAIQLALDTPEVVRSLALLEPPLPVPSAGPFFGAVPPIAERYAAGDKAGALEAFLALVAGPDARALVDAALGPDWFDEAVADVSTFFEVELPALAQWQITPEEIARITQPVLSVAGAGSEQVFLEGHELLQKTLPQCRAVTLPDTNHLFPAQKPRELAEALGGWLRTGPATQ